MSFLSLSFRFLKKKSLKALAMKHLLLSEHSEMEMYQTNVSMSEYKHVSLKNIFISKTNIVYDKNMSGLLNLGVSINCPDHTDFNRNRPNGIDTFSSLKK